MRPTDDPVPVTVTSRGFHNYGEPLVDADENTAIVRESSCAEGPRVRVFVTANPLHDLTPGEASLHLNPDQARALIARLQAWLDEIPARWPAD